MKKKSETSSSTQNSSRRFTDGDSQRVQLEATTSSVDDKNCPISFDKYSPTLYDDYEITTDFLDKYYSHESMKSSNLSDSKVIPLCYDTSDGPHRGTARVCEGEREIDEINFNMDATAIPGTKFGGKHGTHKWRLANNFVKGDEIMFNAGSYLSVISITATSKVVFLSPFLAESNIIPHKCYTIGVKYFTSPCEDECATPTSLNST